MRAEPKESLDPKAVQLWRIEAVLDGGFLLFFVILYFVFALAMEWPLIIGWVGMGAVALHTLLEFFVFPSLRLKRYRYEVFDEEIDLQRGLFLLRRTLIPVARVQHVDTRQGPILRGLGLSVVAISTAATVHKIPALTTHHASQLRDQIAKLARVSDDDV